MLFLQPPWPIYRALCSSFDYGSQVSPDCPITVSNVASCGECPRVPFWSTKSVARCALSLATHLAECKSNDCDRGRSEVEWGGVEWRLEQKSKGERKKKKKGGERGERDEQTHDRHCRGLRPDFFVLWARRPANCRYVCSERATR